ncbi:alkaline phosphatase [Sulfuriroseicoccus oceanibius]|uniref:Alkaline phosphatase n=1 Tax=Sulfuriroseicoccus oceanibius TaxID=2707525 RepID=A0A6B3L973_9BACT|nr:alkaline phosphatase [Sulfuriroseicoccus oceanibius]QQL43767.1 alkaline phosphatase [Sulfuriroseicoccus oceanibius]
MTRSLALSALILCAPAFAAPDAPAAPSDPAAAPTTPQAEPIAAPAPATSGRNVIFFHPDGMGLNTWTAARLHTVGPDGTLAWDQLPHVGIYRGHMKDSLVASSNGAATIHAYGVKVPAKSYGMHGRKPLTAASGFKGSVAEEAIAKGIAVGVVNTGHIAEPGTGCFLASVEARSQADEIAKQVIRSGATVILSGGEQFLLPAGTAGTHGFGTRNDDLNLIEEARELGYTVVFSRDELLALKPTPETKLLGVFAHGHTFNDQPHADLKSAQLPLYAPEAPTIAEMTQVALDVLSQHTQGFLLIAEEEATDNFGNANNPNGVLEAAARSDKAIATASQFIDNQPNTLLLVASDSDAGGLQLLTIAPPSPFAFKPGSKIPQRTANGTTLHGVDGSGSTPFESKPDAQGNSMYFGLAFATRADLPSGLLVRAKGANAESLPLNFDNTDIYHMIHNTLFDLPEAEEAPASSDTAAPATTPER